MLLYTGVVIDGCQFGVVVYRCQLGVVMDK